MCASTCLLRNSAAPGSAWRITIISTFMARMLLTVSTRVSPFLTEELEAAKLMTSALRRFSANSKLNRVRVEFSKNKLAIVMSRSEGTFLIGRLITSLNWAAQCKIKWMSSGLSPLMPKRWRVLSLALCGMWGRFNQNSWEIFVPIKPNPLLRDGIDPAARIVRLDREFARKTPIDQHA